MQRIGKPTGDKHGIEDWPGDQIRRYWEGEFANGDRQIARETDGDTQCYWTLSVRVRITLGNADGVPSFL
jgi:hypothetical protein